MQAESLDDGRAPIEWLGRRPRVDRAILAILASDRRKGGIIPWRLSPLSVVESILAHTENERCEHNMHAHTRENTGQQEDSVCLRAQYQRKKKKKKKKIAGGGREEWGPPRLAAPAAPPRHPGGRSPNPAPPKKKKKKNRGGDHRTRQTAASPSGAATAESTPGGKENAR
jgi:hypothetical protein